MIGGASIWWSSELLAFCFSVLDYSMRKRMLIGTYRKTKKTSEVAILRRYNLVMESIGTIISEVKSFLAEKGKEDRLADELLLKIITTAFYASMHHEELVSLKFDFALLDPSDPDPNAPDRIRVSRWRTYKLDNPVSFTIKEIVKLGLSTDRRTSALAVFADEAGKPFIWGLIDQGTNTHLFNTHETNGGWPYPGLLHISVRDVGHLVITHEGEKVLEIRQDEIVFPPLDAFDEGHLSRMLDKIVDNLLARSEKHISESGFIDDETEDSPYSFKNLLRRDFEHTLSRLILRIQGYGHGGAFVITPSFDKDALNIKYRLNYDRLAEALARFSVLNVLSSQFHDQLAYTYGDGNKTIDTDLYLGSAIADDELKDSEEELTGSIWFTSLLSRVDGLIVFDEALAVRGFGTEILVDDSPKEVLRANTILEEFTLDTAVRVDPSSFGTRHRSMMRYIHKNPDALGFVISQDGAEKIIINIDGKVVYWDNVKLTAY